MVWDVHEALVAGAGDGENECSLSSSFLSLHASETGLLAGTLCPIHSKIQNRLDPANTEKLVYIYSNSKMVAGSGSDS
jgi:hypothetical protein